MARYELYDLWSVVVMVGAALYFERRWRSERRQPWDRRLEASRSWVSAPPSSTSSESRSPWQRQDSPLSAEPPPAIVPHPLDRPRCLHPQDRGVESCGPASSPPPLAVVGGRTLARDHAQSVTLSTRKPGSASHLLLFYHHHEAGPATGAATCGLGATYRRICRL